MVAVAWKIVPGATLHWKMWGDQCVVFNSASGQTHLLDPIPALLVRQIAEGCGEPERLLVKIAELLDIEITPEFRTTLQQLLTKLDALGLIEAVAS